MESNGVVNNGGGFRGMLLCCWYGLVLYLIGIKWGFIELFTPHRKFQLKDSRRRPRDVVIITGGARGIGSEVIRRFLKADMHVIIGCRHPLNALFLIDKLRSEGVTEGHAEVSYLDLISLESVRKFTDKIISKKIPVHLLINNAGIMFTPYNTTSDNLESHFQVNYLSHFLLTNRLLPVLSSSGRDDCFSRIVNVSSCAHYGGDHDFDDLQMQQFYSRYNAYMTSKLYQVISCMDLNKQLVANDVKVRVLSCHPGLVQTDLYQNLNWYNFLHLLAITVFKSPKQGADVIAYTALSQDLEGEGGVYIANGKKWTPNPKANDHDIQINLRELSLAIVGVEEDNFTKIRN